MQWNDNKSLIIEKSELKIYHLKRKSYHLFFVQLHYTDHVFNLIKLSPSRFNRQRICHVTEPSTDPTMNPNPRVFKPTVWNKRTERHISCRRFPLLSSTLIFVLPWKLPANDNRRWNSPDPSIHYSVSNHYLHFCSFISLKKKKKIADC